MDCDYGSDEASLICNTKTEILCERRLGNGTQLSIPLLWIGDGISDCKNDNDEIKEIWPYCGIDKTKRLVVSNETCENVFLCRWERPGYIAYKNLCDGITDCGNENEVCSQYRGSVNIQTEAIAENKGLKKILSYCLR